MNSYLTPKEQSESLTIEYQDNSMASYDPHESVLANSIYVENEAEKNLNEELNLLKDQLIQDTKFDSGYESLVNHPAHLRIVSFGEKVIPFLIYDMVNDRFPWFYALAEITGENPIKNESRGKIDEIINDWFEWAQENNYV